MNLQLTGPELIVNLRSLQILRPQAPISTNWPGSPCYDTVLWHSRWVLNAQKIVQYERPGRYSEDSKAKEGDDEARVRSIKQACPKSATQFPIAPGCSTFRPSLIAHSLCVSSLLCSPTICISKHCLGSSLVLLLLVDLCWWPRSNNSHGGTTMAAMEDVQWALDGLSAR